MLFAVEQYLVVCWRPIRWQRQNALKQRDRNNFALFLSQYFLVECVEIDIVRN